HFNFGYMPSLYLLDLAMRAKQTEMTNSLILADPDGSLLGADTEATAVQHCLGSASHCCIGTNASFEALCDFAPESKIIHFATHSYFNRPTPEGSWLMLANKRHLSVSDIMALRLDKTEMVVLSSCESGLSCEGMEYAALTRAFALAGVPTTVATLWPVADS